MGVLDFLFDGQPPPSVTTYGQTVTSMPSWYTDYTQGLINKANVVAGEGYQPYGGQRIAGFNQDQNKSFDMTRANAGSWNPGIDMAGNLAASGAGADPTGAAQPYADAASGTTYGNVQPYMNPYIDNVIERGGSLAARQFNEKIMPTLQGTFARNGTYGSVAHQREADRAARDLAEGLQESSQGALAAGYNTAGSQYQADASRQAGLAGTMGNLATAGGALDLQGSEMSAKIAQMRSALGMSDAAALQNVGNQQQGQAQKNLDLGYGDFLGQRDYNKNTVDWLSSVIRGYQPPTTVTTEKQGPLDGSKYGPSLVDNLGALAGMIKGWTEDDGD